VVFTSWLAALDLDPVMPEPAGSAWADAVTAITAAAGAVATRFGLGGGAVGGGSVAGQRPVRRLLTRSSEDLRPLPAVSRSYPFWRLPTTAPGAFAARHARCDC
jgi:hypothetical protein